MAIKKQSTRGVPFFLEEVTGVDPYNHTLRAADSVPWDPHARDVQQPCGQPERGPAPDVYAREQPKETPHSSEENTGLFRHLVLDGLDAIEKKLESIDNRLGTLEEEISINDDTLSDLCELRSAVWATLYGEHYDDRIEGLQRLGVLLPRNSADVNEDDDD